MKSNTNRGMKEIKPSPLCLFCRLTTLRNIIFFQFNVNLPAVLVAGFFFLNIIVWFSVFAVIYYVYNFSLAMAGGNKRYSRNNSNNVELPKRGPGAAQKFSQYISMNS